MHFPVVCVIVDLVPSRWDWNGVARGGLLRRARRSGTTVLLGGDLMAACMFVVCVHVGNGFLSGARSHWISFLSRTARSTSLHFKSGDLRALSPRSDNAALSADDISREARHGIQPVAAAHKMCICMYTYMYM